MRSGYGRRLYLPRHLEMDILDLPTIRRNQPLPLGFLANTTSTTTSKRSSEDGRLGRHLPVCGLAYDLPHGNLMGKLTLRQSFG